MPRPKSENTTQLNILVPPEWLDDAQELAGAMSRPGVTLTRADAIRAALRKGLDALRAEVHGKSPSERAIKRR